MSNGVKQKKISRRNKKLLSLGINKTIKSKNKKTVKNFPINKDMYYSETVYLDGKKEMIWYDQKPTNQEPYLEFEN